MARISLGSNVRKGPRRGQVLKHRPQGMVDVQFTDVGFVERHQEKSLRRGNPKSKGSEDLSDPALEQLRRVQMAIYQSQLKRGLPDKEAWKSSFAIAKSRLNKYGWTVPGKMEATSKGKMRAAEKLASKDAWAKDQKREVALAGHRKSGKHRVVSQKHGNRTRYYVQPGGRYFFTPENAEALKDELNGVKMRGRKRKVANPGSYYDAGDRDRSPGYRMKEGYLSWLQEQPFTVMGYGGQATDEVFEYKCLLAAKKKAKELTKTADSVYIWHDKDLVLQYRKNWIGVVAAVATLGDLGYRAVKSQTEKKKEKEKEEKNPRYLDERSGMARGSFSLHSAARNALAEARVLGRIKGLQTLKLAQVPPSRKAHFEKLRRELGTAIEQTGLRFNILLQKTLDEVPGGMDGRRTKAQKAAMGAIRGAYADAYSEVLLERERKRAAKQSRQTPNPKKTRTKGISKASKDWGDKYHWGDVRSPTKFQGMKPTLYRDGEVFYLAYEGKSNKIPRVIADANRAAGLRGAKWRREKSVTSALWKDVDETPTRYSIQHPKSGRGSKSDPYRIYDKEKGKFFRKTFTRKDEADAELWKLQGGTRRDYSPTARGLEDRPRDEQVRSDRQAGEQITAYQTTSMDRAKYVAQNLTFLDVAPGVFERQEFEARYKVEQAGPYRIHKVPTRPPVGERGRFFPKTYTLVVPGGVAFENRPFKSPGDAVTFALRQRVGAGTKTLRESLQALGKAMPRYTKLGEAEAALRIYVQYLRVYGYEVEEEWAMAGKDKETWYTVKSGPSQGSRTNAVIEPVTLTDKIRDKNGEVQTTYRQAHQLKAKASDGGWYSLGTGTKVEMEKLKRQKTKAKPSDLPTQAKAQAKINTLQKKIDQGWSQLDKHGTPGRPAFTLLAHGSGGGIKFDPEGFDLTGPVGKVMVSLDREPQVEQIWLSDALKRKQSKRADEARNKYRSAIAIYSGKMTEWEEKKEGRKPVKPTPPKRYTASKSLGHPEIDWMAALYSKKTGLSSKQKQRIREQREERAESVLMARPGTSPGVKAPSKRRAQIAQFQYQMKDAPRDRKFRSGERTVPLTERDKKLQRIAEIEAELALLRSNPNNGYRKNWVGAAVRGAGVILKSPLGKKIATEAAVVAALMVGDKLVKKGKVSPKAMGYIQRRVAQKTGVAPTVAQVTEVLKELDTNNDTDLTDAEITSAVAALRKKKK